MKCLLSFLCSLAIACTAAQAPFQGKITYNLHTPREKNDARLTAYFGDQKLRLEFSEAEKGAAPEAIVVRLDSGWVAYINDNARTYRIKELNRRDLSSYTPRTIAGHATRPVGSAASLGRDFTEVFGQAVYYVSEDLVFPVPERYKDNGELIMVNENRIVLGADFTAGDGYGRKLTAEDSLVAAQSRINAEAIDVKPYRPDTTLFVIPAGYTSEPAYDSSADSTAVLDSVMKEGAAPLTPKKKKTTSKNKKASPQKSPAYRRKQP